MKFNLRFLVLIKIGLRDCEYWNEQAAEIKANENFVDPSAITINNGETIFGVISEVNEDVNNYGVLDFVSVQEVRYHKSSGIVDYTSFYIKGTFNASQTETSVVTYTENK